MFSAKFSDSSFDRTLEQMILHQISQFGMTTRWVWSVDEALRDYPTVAITRTLRKLSKDGKVEAHPLHHGRFYFTFTKRMAKDAQSRGCQGGPYSEAMKIRTFTKLVLGTAYLPESIPIDREALRERMGADVSGLPDAFMIDRATKRLTLVRIDGSPAAPASRVAQQLRQDVFRCARTPALKSLVRSKELSFAIATCSARRSESVIGHFRTYEQVGQVPIQVYTVPELLPLLLPIKLGGIDSIEKK